MRVPDHGTVVRVQVVSNRPGSEIDSLLGKQTLDVDAVPAGVNGNSVTGETDRQRCRFFVNYCGEPTTAGDLADLS